MRMETCRAGTIAAGLRKSSPERAAGFRTSTVHDGAETPKVRVRKRVSRPERCGAIRHVGRTRGPLGNRRAFQEKHRSLRRPEIPCVSIQGGIDLWLNQRIGSGCDQPQDRPMHTLMMVMVLMLMRPFRTSPILVGILIGFFLRRAAVRWRDFLTLRYVAALHNRRFNAIAGTITRLIDHRAHLSHGRRQGQADHDGEKQECLEGDLQNQ